MDSTKKLLYFHCTYKLADYNVHNCIRETNTENLPRFEKILIIFIYNLFTLNKYISVWLLVIALH